MVTLIRSSDEPYKCETGLVELERVALRTKKMPDEFINGDANFVSEEFLRYARPLIGAPLPEYAHLKRKMIEKFLPTHI
jgi:6-phosphofructokinase 1